MKFIASLLLLLCCASVTAQESTALKKSASKSTVFAESYSLYGQGKYNSAAIELGEVQKKIDPSDKAKLGFIHYWKGLCYNRAQDFQNSINEFSVALGLEFKAEDIHYEYGQALFAADKLTEARLQFRESLKLKFKRAVSLYYIAYVSKELGEKKKAVTFYKAISKLDNVESMEVKQAAEMQIADIYLEQVEKHPDAFKAVESYVIPQYKIAYEVDRNSSLAPEIHDKITTLQSKYDLIMFKLRNGRSTLLPPYFLRLAAEVGNDSNVTFSPTEQQIAESKKSSLFSRVDAIGKYTFYYKDYISVSPELRFNYTRYANRVKEIYRNDNYLLAPAVRTAFEHSIWNRPASVIFDYDYSEVKRDVEEKEELVFASRSHTLTLGERFNYFSAGESIVRLRRRFFDSYLDTSDSNTTSFVFEQVKNFKMNTMLIFASYDITRVENEAFDTNGLTLRSDLIMPRFRDWFTPSIGLGITRTDPINNVVRGTEYLINPNARLSKTFLKSWRGNLKFDYQDNKSDDEANFAYKKYIYSFELEYLF